MINRPNHVLDPVVEIEPFEAQKVMDEVESACCEGHQVIVSCVTKQQAEYWGETLLLRTRLRKADLAVLHCSHSDEDRDDIFKAFKDGKCPVLVSVNLMREGIDIPAVGLVVILS